MELQSLDYSTIEMIAPKAWGDFNKYYKNNFSVHPVLKSIDFKQLPFELQLGVFLKYFNENGVELDVCNTEYSLLPAMITETFQNYEKVISHYS